MSAEFSNTYQEILLDNLVSIIKQNFVFQTQLKLSEKIGIERTELQAKLEDVTNQYNAIKEDAAVIEQLKARSDLASSMLSEKDRIQTALNEYMKQSVLLNKKIEEQQKEITSLKENISNLEKVVPVSKLKKVNVESNKKPVETAQPKSKQEKVNDGSSF